MSNLLELDPRLQPIAQAFLKDSNASLAPSKCVITVTWRNPEAQNAAHAAGLSNAAAGHSPHNCVDINGNPSSRAFDYAILDKDGHYVTNGEDSRYATTGQIGKNLLLVWGGDWTMEKDHCNPDYDHLQMINWKSLI